LDGKIFTTLSTTENGDVGKETLFYYYQDGNTVWADYQGGSIIKGHLIATFNDDGLLQMNYHHLNIDGELMAGKCLSTPEVLDDGRLKFKEEWQWLTGDCSSGYSEIIEVSSVQN